ncbi:hypothetical protein CBFG_04290 [Clostridiales bacterium 1_7_47FAA]|nr:hypothetical protein CBFG_04290 [Clostridiales bacterium 1_7_47FAA]
MARNPPVYFQHKRFCFLCNGAIHQKILNSFNSADNLACPKKKYW